MVEFFSAVIFSKIRERLFVPFNGSTSGAGHRTRAGLRVRAGLCSSGFSEYSAEEGHRHSIPYSEISAMSDSFVRNTWAGVRDRSRKAETYGGSVYESPA